MAHRIVDENSLKTVADAIREKAGTSDSLVFPTGFAEAIAGIQAGGGGGDDVAKSIVDRTITSYSDSELTKVSDYVFYGCHNLESVNLPKCGDICQSSFRNCVGLKHFYAPNVGTVRTEAFYVNIGTSVLESLDFPVLKETYDKAFYNLKALKSFRAPSLKKIAGSCFRGCTSLTELMFPVATSFASYCIYACTSLKTVDCGLIKSVPSTCFYGCTVLDTLILRKSDAITTLSNVNAFTNTPFASGGTGGTVYVPSALIESYKTASNWSALYDGGTCNFVALEGSEYE